LSVEGLTALIIAVTGLVGALGAVFVQLRQTHSLINSRMTELIETTKLASGKAGELAGRDQERARQAIQIPAEYLDPRRIEPPTGTP